MKKMKKNIFPLLLSAFAFAFLLTACEAPQQPKIVELAGEQENLSTLVKAVEAAGLAETLSGEGPFTVFAPTNAAFEALPEGTLENLLKPENKEALTAILTYHVVPGAVKSTDLSDGQKAATVQGEEIMVDLSDGVKINGATLVTADVEAGNGVVHIIDQVILPPSMQEPEGSNIVELALSQDNLSTLVQAVQAAGLVEVLSGEGPFTVFAPTNEAFAALPEGTLEMLLKPENKDALTAVLTYHVVPGAVKSTDLTDGQKAATVQGEEIMVDLSDGVKISGATVVAADVEATNGVVHVIDQVILPPSMQE